MTTTNGTCVCVRDTDHDIRTFFEQIGMLCCMQDVYSTDQTQEAGAISCRSCGFHPGHMS